jgi:hypothetical protein
VSNSERSVLEKNLWKMMLGQQNRSYGAGCVNIQERLRADRDRVMVRLILAVGVVDRVLQIDIGVDEGGNGRWCVGSVNMTFEAMGREVGGDGVRRSWQHGRLLGRHGFGGDSS